MSIQTVVACTVAELCTILDELPDGATWSVDTDPDTGRSIIIVQDSRFNTGNTVIIYNKAYVAPSRKG